MALFDADRLYRGFETEVNPKLANMPSYYWWHNCDATFQDDAIGMELMPHIGAHNVLRGL